MRRALYIAAALIALFLIGSRAWGQSAATPAPAPEKPVLAVLPLEAHGVSERMAAQVTQGLQDELAKLGCFELAASRPARAIDAAQAVALGKELSAGRVIWGSVERSGTEYSIKVGLADVGIGQEIPLTPSVQNCGAADIPLCIRRIAELVTEVAAPGCAPAAGSDLRPELGWSGRPRTPAEFQKAWNGYSMKIALGTVIAVPSLGWTLLTVVGLFGHSEYKLGAVILSIPALIGFAAGIGLIVEGRRGHARLERQRDEIQIGMSFDAKSRSWGVGLAWSF